MHVCRSLGGHMYRLCDNTQTLERCYIVQAAKVRLHELVAFYCPTCFRNTAQCALSKKILRGIFSNLVTNCLAHESYIVPFCKIRPVRSRFLWINEVHKVREGDTDRKTERHRKTRRYSETQREQNERSFTFCFVQISRKSEGEGYAVEVSEVRN